MVRANALAALLLALLVAGCFGGTSGYEMSAQEQQLKTETIGSLTSVDSYRMDGRISVSGPENSVRGNIRGVVDRPDRRAKVTIDMSGAADVEATTYIDNDTAYVNARGMWRTVDVSDRNVWDRNAQLQKQREIFEAADFELVGNDTVDGESVRVVEIHVAEDKLDDLLALTQADADGASLSEVTYTAYVDRETSRLRRMSVDMTMQRDGKSYDATVSMTFSGFGGNATIEIPAEAKDGIGTTTG